MSKILVTGGAGYIGSVLVPKLLRLGHEVTVIDNFMYGQTSLLDACHCRNLKVIRGDARNDTLLINGLADAEWVFPLACLTGAPLCDKDPVAAETTNLGAIEKILRIRDFDTRIIFPTTNSGYGIGQNDVICTEKSPLKPISLYGRLKAKAESRILREDQCLALRLATVFGISPKMRLDLLVNDFVYRAVTDRFVVLYEAHFKRNYIHVRDVVRAILHCMKKFEAMNGQVFNVGLSDANLSKWELCQEIKKQIPGFYFHEAEIGRDPDQRNYIVSNAKIEATGFKPAVSLQEGIAELIKGCQIIRKNQFSNV